MFEAHGGGRPRQKTRQVIVALCASDACSVNRSFHTSYVRLQVNLAGIAALCDSHSVRSSSHELCRVGKRFREAQCHDLLRSKQGWSCGLRITPGSWDGLLDVGADGFQVHRAIRRPNETRVPIRLGAREHSCAAKRKGYSRDASESGASRRPFFTIHTLTTGRWTQPPFKLYHYQLIALLD